MDVKIVNVRKELSAGEIVFLVPPYQRSYDWKHQHCKQWLDDIIEITKNENKTHFAGAIYVKMSGKYKNILIDGNQRITTTMLLLRVLTYFADSEKLKNRIKKQSLMNEFCEGANFYRLNPIKKDSNVFFKIINLDVFNQDDFTEKEKNNNIYKNFIFIYKYIEAIISSGISVEKIYNSLDRLEIAEGVLSESEDPQVVFKGLNATGLELNDIDLLKNRLFMKLKLEDQEYLYENYWLKMENIVKEENLEYFLVFYLMMKHKSSYIALDGKKKTMIGTKNISASLEKLIPTIYDGNKEETEAYLKDIIKFAGYYKNFIFKEQHNFSSVIERKLYQLFYIMEEKESAILLMYLYDLYDTGKIDKAMFEKTLDICLSFSFRTTVCGREGFDRKFISPLISKLNTVINYKNFDKEFWKVITSGKGIFSIPKDIDFLEALKTRDLYRSLRSKKCKYMLYEIEKFLNPKEVPSYEQGTIEHISPRTLSKEWKDYLNDKKDLMYHGNYIDNLGNLTLTGYNSELSNNPFEEKKQEYKKSNYTITREITDSDWTSKQIAMRAEKLAKIALKVWPIPDEYNKEMLVSSGILYDLNSDFASFTGTKPFEFSICDDVEVINSWREILFKTARVLYKEDPDIFLELLDYSGFPGNKKILSTKEETSGFNEVVPGIYMYPSKETKTVLAITKTMVDYFDDKAGSDFKNEIWFSVRN